MKTLSACAKFSLKALLSAANRSNREFALKLKRHSPILGIPLALCLTAAPAAAQTMVGQWTFDGANPLAESTGRWGTLILQGNAQIVNGKLDVNATISGTAANATGWAYARGYTGATIRQKTLISWVSLDNVNIRSGSALTLESITNNNFDAIVYAERVANRWMAGSGWFERTKDVVLFNETVQNQVLQMAISYKDLGAGNTEITICRNGVQLGQYTDSPMIQWTAGATEVVFGRRHTSSGTNGPGGIDAKIEEARIYDGPMTCAQVAGLVPQSFDSDGDGLADVQDNCPTVANADQMNTDGDAQGDACDTDDDNDGVVDTSDNCRVVVNADQVDHDLDLSGDACDADDDNDGVEDVSDNCPFTLNAGQEDLDADGTGDVCDADADGDGIVISDNCPMIPNAEQADLDSDGEGDACDLDDDGDSALDDLDNCPTLANADQLDNDVDYIGDACDADDDNDGIEDEGDNCLFVYNADQGNTDGDALGDACDPDLDGDSILNELDNCVAATNEDQADLDGDNEGDVCDGDDDGDGVLDGIDNCPMIMNASQADFDSDGAGDACDADDDGDSIEDSSDACPSTPVGTVVDPATGCSIAQLCPCPGPRGTSTKWKNHGQYVSCVSKSSENLLSLGLISQSEKGAVCSAAGQSSCGSK